MDGLVTKALAEVVRTRVGSARYAAIARDAGLEGAEFVGGQAYPDEVTLRLVDAAAHGLQASRDEVLELVGEHWVEFAIREGYGRFLTTAGRTFRDVLQNLDRMHEKLTLSYPHLQQPTFWCTDVDADGLVLHYASARTGLAPLVMGIVRGLARMHHVKVEIAQRERREAGTSHDSFLISFRTR